MQYERPQVEELANAINAIQTSKIEGSGDGLGDDSPAYEDWE